MQLGDRETMGVCVCVQDGGGNMAFASRALVVAFIDGHAYLTGYSNCLTGFHEPLSLPCRCHIDLKKCLAQSLYVILSLSFSEQSVPPLPVFFPPQACRSEGYSPNVPYQM